MLFPFGAAREVNNDDDRVPRRVLFAAATALNNNPPLPCLFTDDDDDPGPGPPSVDCGAFSPLELEFDTVEEFKEIDNDAVAAPYSLRRQQKKKNHQDKRRDLDADVNME